ncbi:MAG: hypothetical protein JJT77_10465 [Crocinitomicaceae bacterium]|nr:hypothetical protein [Crocinitomicaceae bacterium]
MRFKKLLLVFALTFVVNEISAQNLLYQISNIKSVDDGRRHLAKGYFHIMDDMAIFHVNARGTNFYIYGQVDDFKRVMKGDQIIESSFFIRGREESMGSLVSFELKEWPDGDVQIHFFKKMDNLDLIFDAVRVPSDEIKALIRD